MRILDALLHRKNPPSGLKRRVLGDEQLRLLVRVSYHARHHLRQPSGFKARVSAVRGLGEPLPRMMPSVSLDRASGGCASGKARPGHVRVLPRSAPTALSHTETEPHVRLAPSRTGRGLPVSTSSAPHHEKGKNMKSVSVAVSIPPSVNHAYRRTWKGTGAKRYLATQLTPEAEGWKDSCGWKALAACRKAGWKVAGNGLKVVVELRVFWPNARRRDIHNLHKLVADALEGVVYTDDRHALLRDMDFDIDRKNPRLELTWYLHEEGS